MAAADRITLGEGNTPLLRSARVGPSLHLDRLYFKLENCNPSGSYKDRFSAAEMGRELFVLWLDAHPDFHTLDTTRSGNLHGVPVAYAIGLIGIAIAGGAMLWGGELTEFGRRACMIGLVVSVLVFAAPLLASAFGVNAAVV